MTYLKNLLKHWVHMILKIPVLNPWKFKIHRHIYLQKPEKHKKDIGGHWS